MKLRPGLLWTVALAACASGEIAEPRLAASSDAVAARVGGDGFLKTGDRRIPVELFVLELRQRVRKLDEAGRTALQVDITVDPDGGDAATRSAEFLVDQLQILGIKQVRVR